MPGEGTYSGQAIAPGVGIEQRVQQLMERGLSQQEAVAQAQRETQQQGQGNGQRSAIMQALATAAQRPSVEVPVAQPPNPKLRILQALSSAGSGLLGARDQAKSDKRNRSSAAQANVINALTKGGAGARGTQEQASPGLLTQLAAVPGQVAGAGLQMQADKQAAEQQTFDNRTQSAGQPFNQMSSLLQRMQEEERIRLAGLNTGLRGDTVESNIKKTDAGLLNKDQDQALALRKQKWAESKFKWERKKAEMDLAGELPDSKTIDALNEAGRSGLTLNQILEDEDMRKAYRAWGPQAQFNFQQAIVEGARLHGAEIDNKMLSLRGKAGPAGSASERMQIADAKSFQGELKDLQGAWRSAGMRGFVSGLLSAAGVGFDPEEDTGSLFMRRVFDDSAVLSDALAGFGLKIARILNGGRPSDRDLIAAKRLLPLQSDSDDLASKKFNFLQTIFQKRVTAIRNQLTTNFGPAEGESAEDYIARAMANPNEIGQATTVEAEQGTLPTEGVDTTLINLD